MVLIICTDMLFNVVMQTYDNYLRTKALSIVYSCFSMLGMMSGVYKVFSRHLVIIPGGPSLLLKFDQCVQL